MGALLAPLAAIGLMAATADDIRAVYWIAVIPAFLSVAVLVLFVREPGGLPRAGAGKGPLRLAEMARLPAALWKVVLLSGWVALSRFSEAFLVLRAGDVGLGIALVPLVMVVMSAAYALSAYPAGALADRVGRRALLALGLAVLVAGDLALAAAGDVTLVLVGTALWGLHLGLTQPLFSALVAAAAPAGLRGTAFGLFHLVTGIALLLASASAGVLWDAFGASAPFLAGAAVAASALLGLGWAQARPGGR